MKKLLVAIIASALALLLMHAVFLLGAALSSPDRPRGCPFHKTGEPLN